MKATAEDSDGIASYNWTHDSDLTLILSGADSESLTVKSPDISEDKTITFTISVTDNNSDSKTSQAQQKVVIKRKVSSVSITGIVTDKPIKDASITVSAGNTSVQVKSNSEGAYTADLVVDESEAKKLVSIQAIGTGEQNQVEFWSLLNSVETVIEQAGEDGVLQKNENFSVNVTNVTTAEYAIITRDGEAPKDDEALKSALLNVDADEKLQLATLIKVVVDNPEFQLPEGVNNTLDLVSSTATAQAFEAEVNEKDPTIIEKTKNEIKEDDDLVTGPSGALVGEYILQSSRFYDNAAYHVSLKDDNTGVIHGIDQQAISNWSLEGNKLSLQFEKAFKKSISENISAEQSTQRIETFVSSMSILILGENEVNRSVEVTENTFQTIDEVEQAPETKSYISNLTSKLQTAQPDLENLTGNGGTWYLDLEDSDYILSDDPEEQVSRLTFNTDGTVTSDRENEEITWRIESRAVVIDYTSFVDDSKQEVKYQGTVSIWLTKVLDAGYQVVTLDSSDQEWPNTEFGLFIKSSDVNVNESTMTGRWNGFYGLNQNYYMDLYPDRSIYFGLERSDYVWDIDGNTMVRRVYMQNGSRVESCVEERDDCMIVGITNHELLAMLNDRYYVKRTMMWMDQEGTMEVTDSSIFIFEYSDDLSITAFDRLLPNYGNSYAWLQDSSGSFKEVNFNRDSTELDGVIEIAENEYINGEEKKYAFKFSDGKVIYEVDDVEFIIEITNSTQEYIAVCWFKANIGCTEKDKAKIWKQLPLMGYSIINNSDYFLGKTLSLNLARNGNGIIKSTSTGGQHTVTWGVATDGVIEVNLEEPYVISSNYIDGNLIENKLHGYSIKTDVQDSMKLSVTELIDTYTTDIITGNDDYSFDATLYYDRDFLDLTDVDFVGKWVAYDRADGSQFSHVEFMADGTGSVSSTFDMPDENGDFIWSETSNKLQLQFDNTEFDKLYMTKDLSVGYQFVDDFDELEDINSGQIIAGILIKDTSPALSKEDYQGRWLYFDGTDKVSPQNGTEINPEDENDSYLTFVFGTSKSSYQGRYEDGQVIRARYFNPNTGEITRYCEPSDSCVLQAEMRYKMLAEHEGRYYWAREFSNYDSDGNESPSSGVIFVGDRNESTDITLLEDYHVDFFYLYQAGENGPIPWYSSSTTNNMGENINTLQIGDTEAVPFTFENGQMHLILEGKDTIIDLVPGSNNKDGLTLCKYLKGNVCTTSDHVSLYFNQPN